MGGRGDNRRMSTIADLNDAEIAELDELLATTPKPLSPLDASMLDGYLCGVICQPRLIEVDEWLPNIFDYDGGLLPDSVDAALRPVDRKPGRERRRRCHAEIGSLVLAV